MAEENARKKPYALDPESAASQENEAEPTDRPKKKKNAAPASGRKKRRRPADQTTIGKKRKKRKGLWLAWFLPLVALLAGGAYYFFHTYLILGTQIVRRDATSVDLRQQDITLDAYNDLREKLPEAEILWNVPLSGGSFSCESPSISLSHFENSDLAMLSYFKQLTYIDAEPADLTVEQYEALSEALPDTSIDWSVPIGGERYPSDSEKITVSSLTESEIPLLKYLDKLSSVDARGCRDYPAIMALREERPDLELTWQVPISGKEYLETAEEILVDDAAVTTAQLEEALRYLPAVKSVDAPANSWTTEEKDALRAAWPEIAFHWPVTICGTEYKGDETTVDLKGKKLTAEDLDGIVKYGRDLPEVTLVDLTDTGVSLADALRVKEVFPNAKLTFAFDLYGKNVTTEDTFIDFTGVKMGSMDQLEAALPLLPKLEKVEMTDCGFSDEEMNKLNKRHEGVHFIWTMHMGRSTVIRTDDQGFIGTMDHYLVFNNKTIKKLTYCWDMRCIDLGHRVPTGLKLDFLYDMPQLEYLVLADSRATDITPIGSLKNLVYLEMILSYPNDLSPLKNCTSLKDLNVCFCYDVYGQKDKNFEIFTSMADHLERLWYSSLEIEPSRYDELAKAMPNTEVHCVYNFTEATALGWRYHERYYQMRDYLHMIYMGDYGGRQYTKIINGQEIPLSKEFLATQREPDWSLVRR